MHSGKELGACLKQAVGDLARLARPPSSECHCDEGLAGDGQAVDDEGGEHPELVHDLMSRHRHGAQAARRSCAQSILGAAVE